MNNWLTDLKKISKFLLVMVSIILTVFIINQFILLYQFISQLHPSLAILVLAILLGALIYLIYKIYLQLLDNHYLRDLGDNPSQADLDLYYRDLRLHLESFHALDTVADLGEEASDQEVIQAYFDHIDQETTPVIIENANAIFLTTAISQNGSLDSLVVLYSMVRMIWQLAKAYKTRPSLMSLVKLYVQVGSVILMARTIEDTDLIEYQLEPLISSVIGESIASAIPGMVPISNFIVGSLLEGAVNAFLTLRVGIIAQNYLKGSYQASSTSIRRSASMQAFKYMGQIIKDNSKLVVTTIGRTVKNATVDSGKKWFKWGKSD